MPIYEYECEKCGHRQEQFSRIIEDEEKEGRLVILCPVCNSQMDRIISGFSFTFSQPNGRVSKVNPRARQVRG